MSKNPREWKLREYVPDDHESIMRVWHEVGWIDDPTNEKITDVIKELFLGSHGYVAELGGTAEAQAHGCEATWRHGSTDLSAWLVNSVTVGRVARQLGVAQALTSETVKAGAERGHLLAFLGMFDQGFYDKLGFGSGSYENVFNFDPADLMVPATTRQPERMSVDDGPEIANAMRTRLRGHGAVTVSPDGFYLERVGDPAAFALGLRDDSGQLTGYLSGKTGGDSSPMRIFELAYQTVDELLELLGILKSLADQDKMVRMDQPYPLVFHDLIRRPWRTREQTAGAKVPALHEGNCWWQLRLLDVQAAVSHMVASEPLSFNVVLSDPLGIVEPELVVNLGPSSSATAGQDDSMPTIKASIGAFSRWWAGVASATSVAASDDFDAPTDLIAELDRVYRPRVPYVGMYF